MGVEAVGRSVQAEIYRNGAFGVLPKVPVNPARLVRKAQRAMSKAGWSYVSGSAGAGRTTVANREALDRWKIVPQMMKDVDVRDTSIELFGRSLHSPFLLAPVGALEMAGRGGDVAVASAAAKLELPMVISSQGSHPMEETAQVLGSTDRWYQLYWSSNDDLVESFIARAEAIGSTAIMVTVDTHLLGWRTSDLDLAYLPFARGQGIAQYTSDPVFLDLVEQRVRRPRNGEPPKPTLAALRTLTEMSRRFPGDFWDNIRSPLPRAAVEVFLEIFSRSSLTWEHLSFLRERTDLPIVIKGLQDRRDAAVALDHGVDGIVVSNHGGRQVDGAIGSLDALPGIAEEVDGRVPVLFDSGIRSGADAFKAIALGARAVLVGRPWVYGLALAGSVGVVEVMRSFLAEFDLTMGLTGCASVSDITRDRLVDTSLRVGSRPLTRQ